MTIKQITLSALAATLVTTASFAGSVTNTGTIGLVGQEKLSLNDVNVSNAFGKFGKVVYTPSNIPATSLKNPIFKFTFGGGKTLVAGTDNNLSVWELRADKNASDNNISNWRQVANSVQISGTNNEIASFNAIDSTIYAYNGKKYIIADANGSNANSSVLLDANVSILVAKASTANLTLQAQLFSGDSQAQADIANATAIAKVGPEFTGSVSRKYNARIDASASFKSFKDQGTTGSPTGADDAVFNLHQNATLAGASLGGVSATLAVTFDQNISKFVPNASEVFAKTGIPALSAQSYNDTNASTIVGAFSGANADTDSNVTLTLTTNGTEEIKKTVFDVHAYVTSGTTKFDLIPKTTGNAGEWTIYGYNAQIPNVAGLSTHETTMKFTNRSTLATDIYFTLIDPDGTVVTLNSTNTSLASLPANTTGTYKASDLLALVTDANFNKTGSFSVEVSIPTTPSSVYGMASFKNVTLGQFKDLPVYNSSTMSY